MGAGWALWRFRREGIDRTRADLTVRAELFTSDGHDLLNVVVSARAVGVAKLEVLHDEGYKPFVVVHRFTKGMLADGEPSEWDEPLRGEFVFPKDDLIEAGETLDEAHVLPLGERHAETLAYRVQFVMWVRDPSLDNQQFSWRATTYVPANMTASTRHNGSNYGFAS